MKAAIFYHQFPHYRQGILDELASRVEHLTLISGGFITHDGIPPASVPLKAEEKIVSNIWFGRILFQPGVLIHAAFLPYDAAVFLANPNFLTTWIAALISRVRGKRVIFWGHGYLDERSSLKNKVRTAFFSLSDLFYCYGYRAKRIAIQLGHSSERWHVGFNSLNYERQIKIRRRLLALPQKIPTLSVAHSLSILCVSRLTPACEYDVLLRALSICKQNGFPTSCTFVGDGPCRIELEQIAAESSLDVKFLGSIYEEEIVAGLLFNADVVISPGKIGLTAIHCMMYGTPAITHSDLQLQMPEVEAVVPGKTGLFFAKGDAASLAQAIQSFRSAFPDRQTVRADCFKIVDAAYNPANQADILLSCLKGEPADHDDLLSSIFS